MKLCRKQFPRFFFHLVLLAVALNVVKSQQPKQQQRPLQPLGDVLHLVLDKDKNQKVTMEEVNSQLGMLEMLFQQGSSPDREESPEIKEYRMMLKGVQAIAPRLFQLLDSNGDKSLTKKELSYASKFEDSLKKDGGMKNFIRQVFEILDVDGDDKLSVDEIYDGTKNDEVLSKVAVHFHELFPLRSTPKELEAFVKETIESIGGSDSWDKDTIATGMKWLDDDEDGFIQKKEVGKYYNVAGKKFMEISKTVKTMGPMLALFGGGAAGGAGGGGGGFKMDL